MPRHTRRTTRNNPKNKSDNDSSSTASEDLPSAALIPRWRTVTIYVLAALLACLLSFTCPQSRMWNGGLENETEQSTATLNQECLFELITVLVLVLVSLFCLQGSDPGYLTPEIMMAVFGEDRNGLLGDDNGTTPATIEMTTQTTPLSDDHDDSPLESPSLPPYHTSLRRKVCPHCSFAPPLRSHHCRICNKCVATFDHHCIFIGTCIGERNHCRFWWFLTAQVLGFITCCSIVNSSKFGIVDALESVGGVLVLVSKMYLYPLTLLAVVMWFTHTVLAVGNLTTFECGKGPTHIDYLRGTTECDLPFSRGIDTNLRLFCCLRDACCNLLIGKKTWTPILWKPPGKIVRDSEDWWEHPWQNKYYSCC